MLPPNSISSSTGSRVVPATESTIARLSPASALSKLDLPTLGRPINAMRRYPSCTCAAPTSGSSLTIASSKSPLPRPCRAETKCGSPNPIFQSACASDSSLSPSTLLATRIVGFFALRSSCTRMSSSSSAPTCASTTKHKTSASPIASSALALT